MIRVSRHPRASAPALNNEAGIVAVWTALLMVVLLGFTGWAVDYSHWNDERTHMQKAADAAALAGAVYLPDDAAGAFQAAKEVAAQNGYASGVDVQIGGNSSQLKVTVRHTVKNSFTEVVGIGSTDLARQSVSEYESPQPLDFVLIIDRTGSMKCRYSSSCTVPDAPPPTPLDEVKSATLAVLGFLNPKHESIALGTLGPSYSNQTCDGVAGAYGKYSQNDDGKAANTTWMIAPYPLTAPANDYQKSDGALNPNSQIVKTVSCLEYGSRTDLGDPVVAATNYLKTYGRPGAKKGIILMTDGAANYPSGTPCGAANTAAATAKAADIQVLTIGFLSGSTKCTDDGSGTFQNAQVTKLLASMASPIKGVAAVDNGCVAAENTDGDNFFCQPKGGDISSVFLAAVGQLAGRVPRIIE